MATVYKGILTNNGKALIANATVNNKVNYSHIALGDANGSVPTPSETRPALINEKARIALNVVEISSSNANQIVCEAIIPSNVGGFYIRELGLYAGTTMVVNSNYPPTYKPLADEGGAREINLKLIINVQNAEVIALYLDDSLIYATREWVNTNYIRRNEIVDNLTTDASNKPLSARQGKYLQDFKLDKAWSIPENSDLNDFKSEGNYFCDLNLTAEKIKNSPTKLAFTLQVERTAGYVQRLTTYKDAGTLQYIRSFYVGEWTPWYKTYSELDPQPTVDAIDNLNSNDVKKPLSANQGRILSVGKFDKSGGTLTGEININTGERSAIKTVINPNASIKENSPNEAACINHALSFNWYDSDYQIGNVRSNSTSSEGFGITLGNSNLRFLVNANATFNYGALNSIGDVRAPSFSSNKDEATLVSNSGPYLFINSNRWGGFSPASGYIPLSVDCGGTGNGQGIAPSASKLQVARKINNVDFDGSKDITIHDSTAFYANGITAVSNEYPAWNAKSGVYQKNENGFSANVLHFLGSGSATAVQLLAYYSNGGLYYRSSRDSVGFEKNFDRVVTETGGIAPLATKLLNARKIFGQNFDGTNDVSGNLTADTGMLLADSYHYIDMGRSGLDRMNFNVYGGVFNFINAQNGSIVARLNSNGIDCNAATASRLQNPRMINGVNFDGTGDINIASPMRFLGIITSSNVNQALNDGFYLVGEENGFNGLYGYGVLEVRSTGGTVNQTYYAHQKNNNGSVAVRQSWDSGQNFSIWRVLDPVGSVSITGAVSGSASFDNSGNISINTSLNNFSSYKAENGYKYLGDGTILQWGRIDSDAAEKNVTVTFPITFPNGCLNISMTRLSAYSTSATSEADGDALIVEGTITNYSFVANLQRFNTSTSMLRGAMWFAIGH